MKKEHDVRSPFGECRRASPPFMPLVKTLGFTGVFRFVFSNKRTENVAVTTVQCYNTIVLNKYINDERMLHSFYEQKSYRSSFVQFPARKIMLTFDIAISGNRFQTYSIATTSESRLLEELNFAFTKCQWKNISKHVNSMSM